MPEPHLPEDLKRWPHDPYALLGVSPGAPAKEVRRAYTRLIRHYKPEQYPEHFRRIRDAFETVQRFGAWYLPPPDQGEPAPEPFPDRGSSIDDQGSTEEMADGDDAPPGDLPSSILDPPGAWRAGAEEDELARLWERACAGEERDAYLALRPLADRPGNPAEVSLRLYWLLRLAPEVDPGLSPCHWLVHGLRGGDWYSPCRDLYRREVERCPDEALSERFGDLLRADAPLPLLAEWLEWRWRAAGRLGRWNVVPADLEAVRPRFTADLQDETWARLLLAALDQLAWPSALEAEKATRDGCAELERLTHLHARLDLHRLDVLLDLSRAWKQLRAEGGVPSALLDLVPRSWTEPAFDLRLPLQAALKGLMRDPERALALFDKVLSRAPVVLAQLVNLIDGVAYEVLYREAGPAASDLERAAAAFLELVPSEQDPPRQEFFRFCLREFVLPEDALQVMERLPGCPAVLSVLRQDVPLRAVCVAYRWFWD
jgi:hypothetical protein